MRRRNTKLFKAMMLGAMAMLMISAHKASATTQNFSYSNARVIKRLLHKKPQIKFNQSADTPILSPTKVIATFVC